MERASEGGGSRSGGSLDSEHPPQSSRRPGEGTAIRARRGPARVRRRDGPPAHSRGSATIRRCYRSGAARHVLRVAMTRADALPACGKDYS